MFLAELLDFIAPLCCLGCFQRMDNGKVFSSQITTGINICRNCAQEFRFPLWPSSQYENTWTLCAYQGLARGVINRIKEEGDERLLQFLLENIIPHFLSKLLELGGNSIPLALIPAPTRRSLNMMNIPFRMCEVICAKNPTRYTMHPIMRLDSFARDSAGLDKSQREKNLAQHLYFSISAESVHTILRDSFIVLLDDVITSGATLNIVRKALMQCNISLNAVLTICHA